MSKDRTIVITGKQAVGNLLWQSVWRCYCLLNCVLEIHDVKSIPKERGIIIEDIHYKPKKDEVLNVLRNYKGGSNNFFESKSIPSEIKIWLSSKEQVLIYI